MKKVILTVGILFIIQSIFCQPKPIGNWIVNVNAGIEEHDKRLFDYAKPEREALLRKQPEFWGTYHFGLNARRKVWQSKRFSSFLGLGVFHETATFIRPFDHHFFLEPGEFDTDFLKVLNRYEKVLTPLSLLAFYELT